MRDPEHVMSLQHLGFIAHQTGRGDLAIDLLKKSLALQPDLAEPHYNLGVILMEQNKSSRSDHLL